jgi:glutathione peroxidase-family protein
MSKVEPMRMAVLSAAVGLIIGVAYCGEKDMAKEMVHGEHQSELYSFTVRNIDGNEVSLSTFKGKVLLIVNVASKCGYTKQYARLEELYGKYKDRDFVVLGFPANNFGKQEPGSNAEIKEFCTTKFHVSFPMFAKISVKGDDIHPLYAYLTDKKRNAPYGGEIGWNFTKFVIGRDGKTVGVFPSNVEPNAPTLVSSIEATLKIK